MENRIQVTIHIEGGVVHEVIKPDSVDVTVIDFDVDGVEPERVQEYHDGTPCLITNY